MTEPQEIADEGSVTRSEQSVDANPRTAVSTMEVDGKVWTVVELPDRESWDLYSGTQEDSTRRLAHITLREDGYYSRQDDGTVRGPYVTLDGATYPLGAENPLLLGDVVDPAPRPTVPPTSPRPSVPGAAGRFWVRDLSLIVSGVGLALLVQRLIRDRRGPAPSRGRSLRRR